MLAVSVPTNVPPALGVPLMTPLVPLSVNPVGNAPLVTANVGDGTPVAVTVEVYEALNVPLGNVALVKAGAWDVTVPLVNAKFVLRAPTPATTENDPLIALAVRVGALAVPEMFVTTRATAPALANAPDAPVAGAVNFTTTPGNGLLLASRTEATSGVA